MDVVDEDLSGVLFAAVCEAPENGDLDVGWGVVELAL